MHEVKPILEYLFVAETYNGTVFKQNPDDISLLDSKRNSFYDLLHLDNPIKRFSLVGKGHMFTVDLSDGHFEIDGRTIYTEPPEAGAKLDLIYYHIVQQRMVIIHDDHDIERKVLKPIRRYYIGWKYIKKNLFGKDKTCKFELGID